jgi:signal transduction histidine kinase
METKRELAELINVNKELATELFITHKELVFQNEEKEKRAIQLIVANKKLSEELDIAHKELAFQNEEKAKRADELIIANKELAFQNEEKAKRAAELIIANKELAFQAELAIANKELAFQNEEKAKRADEFIITNNELKQLLQLNADKDLFISILAHDLRSPFNSLLGLSELLSENIHQYNNVEIEILTNQINKSAQNTFKLLEDILMWARTQSGKIPYKPQTLSFKEICKNILETLRPIANTKNISIKYFTQNETNIFADIDMLKAVMRNLVSNAIKFTNTGGQIDISAEINNSNITITISDNGVGIEPANLTKLFDISQIHTTTGTAEEEGTGLGLVLCKQFVEKHGGEIWVESKYGKGSEFKFTLPVLANQPENKNN